MLLFLSENKIKSKPVGYTQEHCIHKLGEIRRELKILFGVYY